MKSGFLPMAALLVAVLLMAIPGVFPPASLWASEPNAGVNGDNKDIYGKASSLVTEGDDFLKKGQYIQSKARYDEALKLAPNYPPAIQRRQKLDGIIKKKQDEMIRQYGKKCSHIKLPGEIANCQKDLDKIISLNPSRQDLQNLKTGLIKKMGVSEDKTQLFRSAEDLFRQAKYREAKDKFKAVIANGEDYPQAKKYIEKCEAYEPLYEAGALFKDKRYIEARALYQKVLDFDPLQKEAKEGVNKCTDAIGSLSDDFVKKAGRELKADKLDNAIHYIQESLKYNPENTEAKNLMKETGRKLLTRNILIISVIILTLIFFALIGVYYISVRGKKTGKCSYCGRIMPVGKKICDCSMGVSSDKNQERPIGNNTDLSMKLSLSLEIENGPNKGKIYKITNVETFIGSDDTNDIILSEDKAVSRRHAKIRKIGSRYMITDLKTTNMTFVNGTAITSGCSIGEGDVITMGETVFKAII
ncbi:MAG: FHA domain-containing protein [Nitrospirae bacterium]|nr:FHA domain-containing protein [Nitrospirota bacterium]